MGWIGVDFDGTLVEYHGWNGPGYGEFGKPIPLMINRVLRWLKEGKSVQILTARVHPENPAREVSRQTIEKWCLEHLGQILEIRCDKDMGMIELWDDRCVQLFPNTGERVDGWSDVW